MFNYSDPTVTSRVVSTPEYTPGYGLRFFGGMGGGEKLTHIEIAQPIGHQVAESSTTERVHKNESIKSSFLHSGTII